MGGYIRKKNVRILFDLNLPRVASSKRILFRSMGVGIPFASTNSVVVWGGGEGEGCLADMAS